eukprot:g18613.t1
MPPGGPTLQGGRPHLFTATVSRKRTEQDALLLRNRIQLLRLEEERALQKTKETEKKAADILTLISQSRQQQALEAKREGAKHFFQEKIDRELQVKAEKEELIKAMEREELVLIKKLQETQKRQQAAYEVLEDIASQPNSMQPSRADSQLGKTPQAGDANTPASSTGGVVPGGATRSARSTSKGIVEHEIAERLKLMREEGGEFALQPSDLSLHSSSVAENVSSSGAGVSVNRGQPPGSKGYSNGGISLGEEEELLFLELERLKAASGGEVAPASGQREQHDCDALDESASQHINAAILGSDQSPVEDVGEAPAVEGGSLTYTTADGKKIEIDLGPDLDEEFELASALNR